MFSETHTHTHTHSHTHTLTHTRTYTHTLMHTHTQTHTHIHTDATINTTANKFLFRDSYLKIIHSVGSVRVQVDLIFRRCFEVKVHVPK